MNFDKQPETLTELIRSVQAGRYHGLIAHTRSYLEKQGTPVSLPTIRYHLNTPDLNHTPMKRVVYEAAWQVLAALHRNESLSNILADEHYRRG